MSKAEPETKPHKIADNQSGTAIIILINKHSSVQFLYRKDSNVLKTSQSCIFYVNGLRLKVAAKLSLIGKQYKH